MSQQDKRSRRRRPSDERNDVRRKKRHSNRKNTSDRHRRRRKVKKRENKLSRTIGIVLAIVQLIATGDVYKRQFQSYAVGKSRRNISELMDIRPDYANIEQDGSLEQVDPDEVEIGTVIIVQPGEKVPIDGVVVEGTSTLLSLIHILKLLEDSQESIRGRYIFFAVSSKASEYRSAFDKSL